MRGFEPARLARFGAVQTNVAERGEGYVKVALAEIDAEYEPGTDAALIAAGYASITPLQAVCEAGRYATGAGPGRCSRSSTRRTMVVTPGRRPAATGPTPIISSPSEATTVEQAKVATARAAPASDEEKADPAGERGQGRAEPARAPPPSGRASGAVAAVGSRPASWRASQGSPI